MPSSTLMKNRSIRFRFALAFSLVLFVVLCLFSLLIYTLLAHQIRESMKNSLLFAIRQSRQHFFDTKGNFHLHSPEDHYSEISSFQVIRIFDNKGKVLYSSHPLAAHLYFKEKYLQKRFMESRDGKYLIYARPVISSSGEEYLLQGLYYQVREEEQLQTLSRILLILILTTSLLGALVAWFLAYYLLAPFRKIAQEAREIEVQNLDKTLDYQVADDEVGQLCQTLNALFGRLRDSFTTLERFTSNASHELKTPLTVIQGDIEVLLRKDRSPAEYRETLLQTLEEIESMTNLTNSLLLLAQAEGKGEILDGEMVSLSEILEKQLQKFRNRPDFQNREITLFTHLSPTPKREGNRSWLAQIFDNLLSNALHHTPPGGEITVTLENSQNQILVEVKNTGSFISPEDLPHIFEPFYRGQSPVSPDGFGLGLSLVRALVKAHQGQIHVDSDREKGTAFRLTF